MPISAERPVNESADTRWIVRNRPAVRVCGFSSQVAHRSSSDGSFTSVGTRAKFISSQEVARGVSSSKQAPAPWHPE